MVFAADRHGHTALTEAAVKGHVKTVQLLVTARASVNPISEKAVSLLPTCCLEESALSV